MKDKQAAVEWIRSLRPFGYKPGTERMEWMLERLGHPHRRLKFVHIAGTNGKGSTCAFLSSVLRACGYDVGMFLSPHVTTYLSRITLNGEEIEEGPLLEICGRLKPLAEELAESDMGAPTEFEILTMAAILYFAHYVHPDVVIWETGLGGKHDSTNVVAPILAIITNVGLDHLRILGETVEAIAREKAGIIKAGVPLVTGASDPKALAVIEEEARAKKATIYRIGREFNFEEEAIGPDEQRFTFKGPFRDYGAVSLDRLRGVHQFLNASVSMMALEVLRQYYAFLIDEKQIYEGMKNASISGRLEAVAREPLVVLDGAHNPDGARVLSQSVPRLFRYDRLILVLSILQDKLIDEMLEQLLPLADALVLTRAPNRRAAPPEALAEMIVNKWPQLPIYIEEAPDGAVKRSFQLAGKNDLILVTGSLYLVSSIRNMFPEANGLKVGGNG